MSDLEDNITSYSDVLEDITPEERLEFTSLHASLLSDVEGELLVTDAKSAPTSPSRLAFREISPIRTTSTSAPTSPSRLGLFVLRASSVQALVSKFDTHTPSIMAEAAKQEAADQVRKISSAKGWITRSLKKLETLRIAGNDTIDPFKGTDNLLYKVFLMDPNSIPLLAHTSKIPI